LSLSSPSPSPSSWLTICAARDACQSLGALATPTPYSSRVQRRANNRRTLASRRLGERTYWAIFKN